MCLTVLTAERCYYYYTIQPGPTAETCNLGKGSALELQCQVSSDGRPFTIQWHYSSSQPQARNILSTSNFIDNSETTEIKSNTTQNTVISWLTITNFDFKEDSYIWCSVNDPQTTARNPSLVLHIFPCSASNHQCSEDNIIYLRSTLFSKDMARCADRNVSVDVIQARNCSINHKEAPPKSRTTNMAIPPMVTTSHTVTNNIMPHKNTTAAIGSSSLNTYIIIGTLLGGVITVLFCIIIVLLVMCTLRTKVNHQRREHHTTEELSPFDDIRMHISTKTLEICNVDDPNRVSKLLCESNVCYDERPHFSHMHSIENIYEYVH